MAAPAWINRIPSIALPLLPLAFSPALWALLWLAATVSITFAVAAVAFSFIFYHGLQAAHYRYYNAEARLADQALNDVSKLYDSEVMPLGDFIDTDGLVGEIDHEALWVVVLRKASPRTPTFLNFRAYLQPGPRRRSAIFLSEGSRARIFYILHELGHLTRTSHHHALYDRSPAIRLCLLGGLFVALSPTSIVIGLVSLYILVEWFLRGAIRREYLADSFAWSVMAKSFPDWREQARSVASGLRVKARMTRDFDEAIELPQRARLAEMVAAAEQGRGEDMVTMDVMSRLGPGLYSRLCWLAELAAAVAAVIHFDGSATRLIIFLWAALAVTTLMLKAERSKRDMDRFEDSLLTARKRALKD